MKPIGRRCLGLLLAACCCGAAAAGGEPLALDLSVSVEDGSRTPLLDADGIGGAVAAFAARQWPGLLDVRYRPSADAALYVSIRLRAAVVAIETGWAGQRRLRSTVPAASPAALIPTIAGDVAWVALADGGFAAVPPGAPPALAAVLETGALGALADWEPGGLEPLGLASSGEGVTILLPRRWLTLGRLFAITPATARDLLLQPQPAPLPWLSVARTSLGGIRLQSSDGSLTEVDPLFGDRTVTPGRQDPGSLLAAGSLSDTDAEGNRWTWDATERRVRVLGPGGGEVYALKPLLPAGSLPFPQAIATTPDGGLLLGGSGELWRFTAAGVPLWRLNRVPGALGESLPAAFSLAVDHSTGGFWLLDGPSLRLLEFTSDRRSTSASPAEPVAAARTALAEHLAALDARRPADLVRGAELALAAGAPLAALPLAGRLERLDPASGAALIAKGQAEALRDLAEGTANFAEELAAVLLHERAAAAAQRGVDLARSLRDRDPADAAAAALLEGLVARRRELRDASARRPEAPFLDATVRQRWAATGASLHVRVRLRGSASASLASVRVSIAAPGRSPLPATADIGALPAGETREAELELALVASADPSIEPLQGRIGLAVAMSWELGREIRSYSLVLEAVLVPEHDADVEAIARAVRRTDPVVLETIATLAHDERDPKVASLVALDRILRLAQTAGRPTASRSAALPSPRAILRELPADERQWAALAASVLAAGGAPVGLLHVGDRLVVLTRVEAPDGLSVVPIAAGGGFGLAGAVAEGRRRLTASGGTAAAEQAAAWIAPGPTSAAPPPATVPLILPALSSVPDRDRLLADIFDSRSTE